MWILALGNTVRVEDQPVAGAEVHALRFVADIREHSDGESAGLQILDVPVRVEDHWARVPRQGDLGLAGSPVQCAVGDGREVLELAFRVAELAVQVRQEPRWVQEVSVRRHTRPASRGQGSAKAGGQQRRRDPMTRDIQVVKADHIRGQLEEIEAVPGDLGGG